MLETDKLVILILIYAIIVLILIRYFHDFYIDYKISINLLSLVFFFILYMCYLYSVKKIDIGFNESTIIFGVKLLAIICLFVIFCKIVQYFINGNMLSFFDSILSYLENLFNCKISWNEIILFGVCLIICYFIGFKKIFNFVKKIFNFIKKI